VDDPAAKFLALAAQDKSRNELLGAIAPYRGIPIIRSKYIPKDDIYMAGDPFAPVMFMGEGVSLRVLKWHEILWRRVKRVAYIAAFGWSGAPYAPKRGEMTTARRRKGE
jgi:hypothetical protein